jgi:exopolysaccharide production protein ExoZ
MTPLRTQKLEGIQVLRGVAALLVMWCHLKINLGVRSDVFSNIPWLATNIGAIGVDIFFVISGFVIAMTAAKLDTNWRAFMAGRIARIVPLYFLISTYSMIWQILRGLAYRTPTALNFREVFNTYLFIPVFDTGNFQSPITVNGWTLSFEMWFYMCFAGLMAIVGGKLAGKCLPSLLAVGVACTLLFYHAKQWFLPNFLFHPIVLEFCAGCILYHARDVIGKKCFLVMCFLSVPLFCVANHWEYLGPCFTIMDDRMLGLHRTLVWGGFSVCLVGIASQIDLRHSVSYPKLLLMLGNASYSIYLIQPLIIATFVPIFRFIFHVRPSYFFCGLVYVVGTILFGLLLWRYFEVPVTPRAKDWCSRVLRVSQPNKN